MLDIKTTFNNVEESGISKDVPLSFPISNSDVTRAGEVITPTIRHLSNRIKLHDLVSVSA